MKIEFLYTKQQFSSADMLNSDSMLLCDRFAVGIG